MPKNAALHDYSELFTSTQAYISGVQEDVRSFVRMIGVDRFSRADLERPAGSGGSALRAGDGPRLRPVAEQPARVRRRGRAAPVLLHGRHRGVSLPAGGRDVRTASVPGERRRGNPPRAAGRSPEPQRRAAPARSHLQSATLFPGHRALHRSQAAARRSRSPIRQRYGPRSTPRLPTTRSATSSMAASRSSRLLGQGSFSKVYRVRDEVEDEERALKLFNSAAGYEAVRREIGALRKIRPSQRGKGLLGRQDQRRRLVSHHRVHRRGITRCVRHRQEAPSRPGGSRCRARPARRARRFSP